MSMLDGFLHRLSVLWHREQYARDLEDEMRHHRELEDQSAGMEAPRDPQRFGSVTYYREETRAMTPLRWLDRARQDTTYAVRSLSRSAGFSLAVVVILALGFGVNAAMFSLFNALYLHLPDAVPAPLALRRLYIQTHAASQTNAQTYGLFQYPEFRAVSEANATIPMAAETGGDSAVVEIGGARRNVRASEVSGTYFDVLGLRPQIGRFFAAEERAIESPTLVAIISDGLWRQNYGASTRALGQTIRIDRRPFTIIGVAPAGFHGLDLDVVDVWTPLNTHIGFFAGIPGPWYTTFGTALHVITRLPATATVRALSGNATDAFHSVHLRGWGYDPKATVLVGPIVSAAGPVKASEEVLVARRVSLMAAFVLLIAAANAANLMLLRVSRRAREIAVRRALGVSRGRLIEQIAVESVVLAAFAAVVASAVAYWAATALRNLAMPALHISVPVLDLHTVGFIVALSLTVGLLVGIVPAVNALRTNVIDSLRAGSRDVGYRRSHARQALVIVQTALCVVLLAAAGLFVRSLDNVRSIGIGYDRDHLMLVSPTFDDGLGLHATDVRRVLPVVAERLRHLPAVEDVSLSSSGPMMGVRFAPVHVPGRDTVPRSSPLFAPPSNEISPSFFRVTGLRVLQGRGFTDADRVGAPLVVVVTRAMANAFWPGSSPLGKCLIVGRPTDPCSTVVGVVENAHAMRLLEGQDLIYFRALAQDSSATPTVIDVRVRRMTGAAVGAVRAQAEASMRELLPAALGTRATRMQDLFTRELRPWILGARLFTAFGLLALIVAAFGVYSVVAYAAAQRTNELGIRVALGARASDIVDLVIAESIRMHAIGIAVGIAAALLATRLLRTFLFGVTSQDPAVFAGCIALMTAVATVACAIPGWRASRIDPAAALRIE